MGQGHREEVAPSSQRDSSTGNSAGDLAGDVFPPRGMDREVLHMAVKVDPHW